MFEDFVVSRARQTTERGIAEHLKGLEEEMRQGCISIEYDGHAEPERFTEEEISQAIQAEREAMQEEFERRDRKEVEKIMEAYDRRHMERPLPPLKRASARRR